MTRLELYERVWQTPMIKLAAELNLSDVGLAKICRSFSIPRPAAGHWAKVAAGTTPNRPVLAGDPQMRIPRLPTAQVRVDRASHAASRRAIRSAGLGLVPRPKGPDVVMRSSLDECLPIVAKTARFFAAIPIKAAKYESLRKQAAARGGLFWGANEHSIPSRITGRFNSFGDGRLTIAATLSRIDWILRFHDALLRALIDRGCKVVSRNGKGSDSYWVEIKRDRGVLIVSFAEDFEKSSSPMGRWDKDLPDTGYRAKDTMRLKVRWEHGSERKWTDTPERLEAELPNIVCELDAAISRADADLPALLEARAASQRRQAEERIADEHRREAVRQEELRLERELAWLERAIAAGDMQLRLSAARQVLDELERRAPADASGERVRAWVAVVRTRMQSPADSLLAELLREFDAVNSRRTDN